jgi:hypothetical protein
LKASAVVLIGVDRHGVGSDDGAHLGLPFTRRRVITNFALTGF